MAQIRREARTVPLQAVRIFENGIVAVHDDVCSPVLVIIGDITSNERQMHGATRDKWEFSLNFYSMNNSRDFLHVVLSRYTGCLVKVDITAKNIFLRLIIELWYICFVSLYKTNFLHIHKAPFYKAPNHRLEF